tara:strand:+ start:2713 stop:2865 length:153 start_codon:yes stop_codon:yes gene_type:complete
MKDLEQGNLATINIEEFKKSVEFIKSKMNAEDYAELKANHNFYIQKLTLC